MIHALDEVRGGGQIIDRRFFDGGSDLCLAAPQIIDPVKRPGVLASGYMNGIGAACHLVQ